MMKKIFVLFIMSILLLPIFALASESEPYESYIDMSTGSTLYGSYRKYSNSNHHIKLYTTYLGCLHGEISENNRLTVRLEKKSLLGSSLKASSTISLSSENKYYQLNFSGIGSGKFRYVFGTGSSKDPYGTIKADPVTMWSSKS